MTVAVEAPPTTPSTDFVERVERRLDDFASSALPLLDPHSDRALRGRRPMAPEHYEAAVARAVS